MDGIADGMKKVRLKGLECGLLFLCDPQSLQILVVNLLRYYFRPRAQHFQQTDENVVLRRHTFAASQIQRRHIIRPPIRK